MNRHIKFLEYLEKIGGDVEAQNVTKKLVKLGLSTESHVYEFLESLRQKGFIEWEDNRPKVRDFGSSVVFMGGIPDENAPLNYTAKILLPGLEHLDDRTIKTGQNKWLVVSIIVGAAFGLLSAYLTYSNNEKDIEIRTLNTELVTTKKALQSLIEQRAKESTVTTTPPRKKKINR